MIDGNQADDEISQITKLLRRTNPMKPTIQLAGLFLAFLSASCMTRMETIPSGSGPEDLSPVRVNGRDGILTGTANRRAAQFGFLNPQGALELHVPGRDSGFRKIFPQDNHASFRFVPTGICTVRETGGGNGDQLVYVANTAPNKSKCGGGSVEVFRLAGENATYLGRLGQEELPVSPNGIAVAPDGSVYVSSFLIYPTGKDDPHIVPPGNSDSNDNSIYCFRPDSGSLLKGRWTKVACGFDGLNGLALDSDGGRLLACSYHANTVWMLERDAGNGRLTGTRTVLLKDLDFHPDNLKHLGNNRFTVGGQKSLPATLLNIATWLPVSPGGAVEFTLGKRGAMDVVDLTNAMGSDGKAPTTAVRIGGAVFFGHVFAAGVSKMDGAAGVKSRTTSAAR